ncbi:MAG TPA: YceK/YidQ family lipoprotein [Gemmataceae bacterium]|nr:YceK/YidQ family lipoprotein [Gemmataceae bacterium]
MARRIIAAGLAIWAASALCGCGTLMNTSSEPPGMARPSNGPTHQIYGGVRHDATLGSTLLLEGGKKPPVLFLGAYLLAVDMPLSLVGDTLTLPWMVAATVKRWRGPEDEAPPAPRDPPQTTRHELDLGDLGTSSRSSGALRSSASSPSRE